MGPLFHLLFYYLIILFLARWLSWLERRPVTAEVVGSSPIRVVYAPGAFAGMAELADAQDLKSCGTNLPYRFDSGCRQVLRISYFCKEFSFYV